jgi:hypothetical protein
METGNLSELKKKVLTMISNAGASAAFRDEKFFGIGAGAGAVITTGIAIAAQLEPLHILNAAAGGAILGGVAGEGVHAALSFAGLKADRMLAENEIGIER